MVDSLVKSIGDVIVSFLRLLRYPAYVVAAFVAVFFILVFFWVIKFVYFDKRPLPKRSESVRIKKRSSFLKLFIDFPRAYAENMFNKRPDDFPLDGVYLFCGEQGCGKTLAAVEMMLRLKKEYPSVNTITNFGLNVQDAELLHWRQLVDFNNGRKGVVCAIDELQTWFQSGVGCRLDPAMLGVVCQNRKNSRIIIGTSQVFTRVSKGIREQVKYVLNPTTLFGCLTIVAMRKPVIDDEGKVIKMKWAGIYYFVHTKELYDAYDTYRVIETLTKEEYIPPLRITAE